MKFRLRTKLTVAFLAVILVLFILIGVSANYFLEKQFREYVIVKQEKSNLAVVAALTARYTDWGDVWDPEGLENIGANALQNGLMLRIMDADGTVLWDAMVHNSGMCVSIIENMADSMQSRYAGFDGGYEEKLYPVISEGQSVGTVAVGYYGPYYYSDSDMNFISALNRLLTASAGIAVLAALLLAAYLARQLTVPIRRVTETAGNIARGDLHDRIRLDTTTTEISELTGSINSLAESLEKQETLRKRLTADVAHELRTPLATLQSHLEAMIDGVWEPDARRLSNCHEETLRLTRIVNTLEELSRYDSENPALHVTRFNLAAMIDRVAANFENEFRKKGVAIELDIPELFIVADEDKLSQVFVNLLSNAVKYTPAGGRVSVRLSDAGDHILAVVSDTGSGISTKDLPYIFERFFRADRSRDKQTGGAGIGLAIVRSIVAAHHGTISAESELEKGSRFTVRLPKVFSHERRND